MGVNIYSKIKIKIKYWLDPLPLYALLNRDTNSDIVQYGKSGKPLGIMYMTQNMKISLLCYSIVMFLDAQKRQMNKMGWSYIGNVIMNNMFHVQTYSKDNVTSEDIATYAWVMQSMVSIVTKWSKSDIKITIADGLITNYLLRRHNSTHYLVHRGDNNI